MKSAIVLLGVLGGCGPTVVAQTGADGSTVAETSSVTGSASTTAPDPPTTEESGTSMRQTSDSSASTSSSSSTYGSSSAGSDSSGTTQAPGCSALDILIVLDDTMYMPNMYIPLAAAGFAEDLIAAFPGKSLHVGLTLARDGYMYGGPDCGGLGSLVTSTEIGECELSNGLRFATDEDDLSQTLPCLMNIDTGGEGLVRPISATIAALSDEQAQPDACNEGFLRDDALLGIFIFTMSAPRDQVPNDAHPDTDTSAWYSSVLAAKDGDPAAIAVFGFISMEPVDCLAPPQVEAQNFIEFIDAFEHSDRRTICQGGPADFEAELADGIELVAQTCADWDGP